MKDINYSANITITSAQNIAKKNKKVAVNKTVK
jgi:hypothetical protein